MKSQMRLEFEAWFDFEVSDDMDIQTSVAWDNWKIAWHKAMAHAKWIANRQVTEYAYTPSQKRAIGSFLTTAIDGSMGTDKS